MLQPKITEVEPLPDYHIRLVYETGEVRLFDVAPYISGAWFGRLADKTYFRTVRVVDGGRGIEWVNGQDIAPHELYESSVSAQGALAQLRLRFTSTMSDCPAGTLSEI